MATFDSQQLPAVHYCRFDWCISSFSTPSEYIRHAFAEHIRKLPFEKKCFRRKELADIERAEEGIGETMSLPIPSQMIGLSLHSPPKEDSTCQQLPSSLPTPPVSEAASPPTHIYPIHGLPQDAGVDPNLLSAPSPTPAHLFSAGDGGQYRMGTPSFRDLSSPAGSPPFMADNPDTPDFDSMIEDAIHPRKRQRLDANPSNLGERNPSIDSATSNEDCDAIQHHLTQSLDDDTAGGELQLSDLIHQERIDDMPSIENSGPGHNAPYADTSTTIRMPVLIPLQSQPFSTQSGDLYVGEIFQSHVPSDSPELEPAPMFQPTEAAHSTLNTMANKSQPSQESENSTASNSSDLSMPPPAQPPHRTTRSQSKSLSQESQQPTRPDPFFFPSSGASARKPFYPQPESSTTGADRQTVLKKEPSPTRPPQMTPKHRRKAKSRNPRGLSGTFDLMAPQSRHKASSPLNYTSNRVSQPPSPERPSAFARDESGAQPPRGGWENQSQDDETLPPIMTQAPYRSQDS